MARWWRGRSKNPDDPPGRDAAPDAGAEPEPGPAPAAEWVATLTDPDGTEREIARIPIPAEQHFALRADATLRRLGPDHPETLAAFRDHARVLGQIKERRAEARERLTDLVRTQARVLGHVHADTMTTAADLVGLRTAYLIVPVILAALAARTLTARA